MVDTPLQNSPTDDNVAEVANELGISSATSLGILLIVFIGIFFMALFVIITGKAMPEGAGRYAFKPADFPEVFSSEPVDGLDQLVQEVKAGTITAETELLAHGPESDHPLFNVARPPFSEDIFPCSNCHGDMTPDETMREVGEPHDVIKLNHGNPKERWCLDCHNAGNRDLLRLVNGKTITFEESHRLCGQCHGNVYRDWKNGIHGKRVGFWDGPKIYLLCVHCHNPHSPRFKPITPLPPPVRPDYQREITTDNQRHKGPEKKGE